MSSRGTRTVISDSASDVSGWGYPNSIREPNGAPGTPLPRDHHLRHAQIVRKLEKERERQESVKRRLRRREGHHGNGFPVVPSTNSSAPTDSRSLAVASAHSDNTLLTSMAPLPLGQSQRRQHHHQAARASPSSRGYAHTRSNLTLASSNQSDSYGLDTASSHSSTTEDRRALLHSGSHPNSRGHHRPAMPSPLHQSARASDREASRPRTGNSALRRIGTVAQEHGYTLHYMNGQYYPLPSVDSLAPPREYRDQ